MNIKELYDALKDQGEKPETIAEQILWAAQRVESDLAAANERAEKAEERANQRHSSIAKAVYETVQDAAATWETASDALIWDEYDVNGPQHQPVSQSHIDATCVRFPQWAEDLRSFAKRWNEDDLPLTDEQLATIEHDVNDEAIERGSRRAMQMLRFYDKLRKVEQRAEAAERRAEENARDADRYRWLRSCNPVYSDSRGTFSVIHNVYENGKFIGLVILIGDELDSEIDERLTARSEEAKP